jgi:hypothetical protein
MYKLKIVVKTGQDVIRMSEKGNRMVALRAFSQARELAQRGAVVKVIVRAPDGRVSKHNFRAKNCQ